MEVTFRIKRYTPEVPGRDKPYWQEFTLKDVQEKDRVLELLHRIKWEQDGSLTMRRSCSHGICGSDAMRINGVNALACKLLVRDVGTKIQVEPILGLPVVKDLVVDMEPFFEHYRSIMPFVVNNDPLPADGRERLQSQQDKDQITENHQLHSLRVLHYFLPELLGKWQVCRPAAIVQSHRFIFDTRDQITKNRLGELAEPNGVWRCRTIYNCTPACPRGIQVTKAIGEVKLAIQRSTNKNIVRVSEIAEH